MAAVFDIELHDADTVNGDESDDDVIEIGEVNSPSARDLTTPVSSDPPSLSLSLPLSLYPRCALSITLSYSFFLFTQDGYDVNPNVNEITE